MGDNWNKCSQSLRVKKVKIIYILAAGNNVHCKAFFSPRKLKHCGHTEKNFFFLEMRRKLLIFNYRIPVFPKNTDHDHMYFLVKYKIPRLYSGMSNTAIFLSQSQGFNLQLLPQNSVWQVAVLLFWNHSHSKSDS